MDIFINHGWILPDFSTLSFGPGAPYPWSTKVVTWGHHRPCVVHPWSNESPGKNGGLEPPRPMLTTYNPGIMNGWNRINRGLEDEKILCKGMIFEVNHENFPGCVSILNFRGVNPSKAERWELSFVLVWSFRFANALIAHTHSDSTPGSKLV